MGTVGVNMLRKINKVVIREMDGVAVRLVGEQPLVKMRSSVLLTL